ncbi:hypothetical protein HHL19_32715 [Streptomyces sp. R302]|uniref:hypothetical protein n=1 Tax=unclassified Streptomyces TaxID=2593676 RepID=UPI00145C5998|nr:MULTISPECIES: hypothetical protein [unclassified Streptomyces]NML54018.1 hypothetical protein [Streptomyces sp. R301]NML83278.1 hypothetical protein [Streptomyces sp. R302]
MSRLSPAQLRMAGLGTAVALAVLVPLAATAGQPDEAPPSTAHAPAGDAKPGGASGGLLGELGLGGEDVTGGADRTGGGDRIGGAGRTGGEDRIGGAGRTGESARPAAPVPAPARARATAAPTAAVPNAAAAGAPERVSRCGPELASPEGVEAQTCVLSEGPDVWARTYYRNATGREIDAILTLMAPGGRTVQVRCAVPARDEPDTCETPREPGTGAARAHTAVAEFAGKEEGGDAPLLLRSGSNTAEDEAS